MAGASRHQQNDVSLGRNAGSLLRRVSWILEVSVWRCRARLPNVLGSFLKFDDWSYVGCRLSPRDRAIIREVNETAFSVNFLETGGIGCSESCDKVVCHLG